MSKPNSNTPPKSPTDIARETFRQLAIQRIAPTPDAYQKLYNQIAGIPDTAATQPDKAPLRQNEQSADPGQEQQNDQAENLLKHFANSLLSSPGELSGFGYRLKRAISQKNWADFGAGLDELTNTLVAAEQSPAATAPAAAQSGQPLEANPLAAVEEDPRPRLLKDLLYRTLTLALTSLLRPNPPLAQESEALGLAIRDAETETQFNQLGPRLKQLCFQIELQSGDQAEQQELLLRLFDLLLGNIHDLLDNDNWLRGQIEVVKNLIAGPIDHRALQEATRSLKDVIYKQGTLKTSIDESRNSVKHMMAAFLERLDAMASSTSKYQNSMDQYASQIGQAQDIRELSTVIGGIISETRVVQTETLRSRDIIVAAQKEVAVAEAKIKDLEHKLAQMSELVREDQLTGSLNRRGMEDIFERETGRADRRNTPLCVAMLDLDNFKKLNDQYGHAAGDEALVHLVRVVKQTLRSIDVIARYGGEEFVIIMPETEINEAAQAMTRVQRELTKHFFTSNDQRLFITFSAGVALREFRESQDSVLKRADKAMYEAKKTGKNRVVVAD